MAVVPLLPYNISANSTVDISFKTAVNESESGISGRKSLWGQPIRTFNLTIGPEQVVQVYATLLACIGSRYPIGIRDWTNYQLDNAQQVGFEVVDYQTIIPLGQTLTPAEGLHGFTQRILLPDDNLEVMLNGSPIVAPYTIESGTMVLNQILSPGHDIVTVSGTFYTPVTFLGDMLTITMHAQGIFSIQNLQLREVLEDEFISLTQGTETA